MQRPDDRVRGAGASPPARGPRRRAAAAEKRLGLVVARVADGDDVRVEMRARPIEERVTRRVRGVLDRSPLAFGTVAHVLALDENGHAERARRATRRIVRRDPRPTAGRVGLHAKLMVEMRQPGDGQLAGRFELAQQVHERHRVGAARQRDHHARPGAARSCRRIVRRTVAINMGWQGRLARSGGWRNAGRAGPASDCRPACPSAPPALPLVIAPISWCRRTDSNRRPRAYETRALTN